MYETLLSYIKSHNPFKNHYRSWGDSSDGKITCSASLRPWVEIPSMHIKVQAYLCIHIIPELESRDRQIMAAHWPAKPKQWASSSVRDLTQGNQAKPDTERHTMALLWLLNKHELVSTPEHSYACTKHKQHIWHTTYHTNTRTHTHRSLHWKMLSKIFKFTFFFLWCWNPSPWVLKGTS